MGRPLLGTRQERGIASGKGSSGATSAAPVSTGELIKPGTRRPLPSLPPSTSVGLGLAAGVVVSASSAPDLGHPWAGGISFYG